MPITRPTPVYAVNEPLADLRTAELFVISSLRLWVLPHRDPTGVHPDWRGGFVAAGIDDFGAPAFDGLFQIVAATARRSLDVRCLRCARLGEDEGFLLQLLSLLQRERTEAASAILRDWLPSAAARLALLPAQGFARALMEGGLSIPVRHAEAASADYVGATGYSDRGLALVQ
jgi:hypothetical protein